MAIPSFDAFGSIQRTTLDALGKPVGVGSSAIDQGGDVKIEQIEGSNRSTVVLGGRARPEPGVSWGGEQVFKKTVYPGNPVASVQMLSSNEMPTEMVGTWKDRFMRGAALHNGEEVQTAQQLVALFERMRAAGRLVRVNWFSQTRVGLIKEFTATFLRATDVQWEIAFEWVGFQESPLARGAKTRDVSSASLITKANRVMDKLALIPASLTAMEAATVSYIAQITETLGDIVDLFRAVETGVSAPIVVVGALKASVQTLGNQVNEQARRLGDRLSAIAEPLASSAQGRTLGDYSDPVGPTKAKGFLRSGSNGTISAGALYGTSSAVPVASAVTNTLTAAAWTRDLSAELRELFGLVEEGAAALERRVQPQTIRTVVVRQGETLRTVADREMGSAELWTLIAQANSLPTSLVAPGTVVRIPGNTDAQARLESSSGPSWSGKADPNTGECVCEDC